MFQLISQRDILQKVEKELTSEMIAYATKIGIPVIIEEVNIGSVQPQPMVLAEISNTAAKIQNQKTQIEEGRVQEERRNAEEKRAIADLAYQKKMGLTTEQFVQLEIVKMYDNASGKGTTMIFGNVPGITINK